MVLSFHWETLSLNSRFQLSSGAAAKGFGMMDKLFTGVLVLRGASALWQGYRVQLAASIMQTLCILLGIVSKGKHGLGLCLCCLVHRSLELQLHAMCAPSYHPLVLTLHSSWVLTGPSSLSSACSPLVCSITASSPLLFQRQVPHACFSQAPCLQSSLFLSLSLRSFIFH